MIRAIARFSVKNSIGVNLSVMAVIAGGVVAYLGMPREVFPEFSMDQVVVTTPYPGASPEDVERLVTLPIEEQLEGIDDLREMFSQSQESLSIVTLKIESRADTQRFLEEVRSRVQSGDLDLPVEAEEPFVREIRAEFPVIAVFVYGNASEVVMRDIARDQERALEQMDGVSSVQVTGVREPRVWVEVDPLALERYGLALADVGAAVEGRVRSTPLGSLSTESGDYLMRVESEVLEADDILDMPVLARPDGSVVRLSQVARVFDTFERQYSRARFNGEPSIHLQVNKNARGDTIDMADAIQEYVAQERERMPAGVSLGTNSDLSVYVKNRLRVMTESGTLGGILVLVSLVLFLNLRVASMTALGIPISFLGGLLLASLFGITMNMITMFALIIVLGMIVDDAIVVSENGYRLMEEGHSPEEAAVIGTAQVGKPVVATILTTMAAFLPILLMGGTIGQFMRPLPLIVTFCLITSLWEALCVLPAHLAHWSGKRTVAAMREDAGRRWYEPLRAAYSRVLALAVRWRYVTLALASTTALLFLGYATIQMPFNLFDDFESKVFYVNIRAVPESSLDETERLAIPIQDRILELPDSEVESVNLLVGIMAQDASRYELRQNLAQIWIELREGSEPRRPTGEIVEELRQAFRDPSPGIVSVDIDQPQAGPTGRAIDLSVRGPDPAVLRELAADVKAKLSTFAGVRDVRDDAEFGKREIEILLTEEGRTLGFTEVGLGLELRASFEGMRFASIRRGRDDVEVVVKLPESVRDERAVLSRLRFRPPAARAMGNAPGAGAANRNEARVPLSSIAELREHPSLAVISRDDGERAVRVTADVNKKEGNAARITEALRETYAGLPNERPGYTVDFKGDYKDTVESLAGLKLSLTIAAVSIFVILGALFRSLSQPFVIMYAIPMAGIGAVLGHILLDRAISMMSLMGILALGGIVVNDSLILVDRVNSMRADGEPLVPALLEAGRQRFRPIVLTSITTMVGLSPLTFFATGQARFLQPMAISIFFGLGFATVLILIVVPCAYAVLEDALAWSRSPFGTARRFFAGEPFHAQPVATE